MGILPMFCFFRPFTKNHSSHGLEARATAHKATGSVGKTQC